MKPHIGTPNEEQRAQHSCQIPGVAPSIVDVIICQLPDINVGHQ
jgi:hypothetical protein